MTNTIETAWRVSLLRLPVLPKGYRWNIRSDQGDGEFQLYLKDTTLLITLERSYRFFGVHGIRATGSGGYYVNVNSTNEYIEQMAAEIHQGWLNYLARQPLAPAAR